MIGQRKKPSGYKPYERVNFCSNLLIGGGDLIVAKGETPLLIGVGDTPLVWLKAPTDASGNNYVNLVEASVAKHPLIGIFSDHSGLTVSVSGMKVLHVYQLNPYEAVVDFVDLRSIGYEVQGDSTQLSAGGMRLSGNTMQNAGAMLSLG